MVQVAYPLSGSVALNTTLHRGAKVWARDLTEGTIPEISASIEDIKVFYTNQNGEYLIDLANITSAYANADTVRIFCQVYDKLKWEDVTVNTTTGYSEANFGFTNTGPTGRLNDTPLATGKGGAYPNPSLLTSTVDNLT